MLGPPDVGGVGVTAGAGHVAELAAQGVTAPGGGARGASLHRGLLLLVLLALQVLLVGLRTRARDLADLAVMQLLRLGGDAGALEDPGLLDPRGP